MKKLKWFLLFFIGAGGAAFVLFFIIMEPIRHIFFESAPWTMTLWGALGCGVGTGLWNGTMAAIRLS